MGDTVNLAHRRVWVTALVLRLAVVALALLFAGRGEGRRDVATYRRNDSAPAAHPDWARLSQSAAQEPYFAPRRVRHATCWGADMLVRFTWPPPACWLGILLVTTLSGCATLLAAGLGADDETLHATVAVDVAFISGGFRGIAEAESRACQCVCGGAPPVATTPVCADGAAPSCDWSSDCCPRAAEPARARPRRGRARRQRRRGHRGRAGHVKVHEQVRAAERAP